MSDVKDAETGDLAGLTDALVSAFHDDPVMLHIFNKPGGREKKMRALFASEMKRALKKGAVHTTADGPAKGGAIWMAPGQWRTGGLELLGQLPLMFAMGASTTRALSVLSKMEKVHPTEPHWYLAILGTATAHQGKGVGSAVLQPILSKCDAEGIPAYLESSKESNIAFYNRHGFEVTGEVKTKDGPTLWPMWREPRPPDA
jgi:ribosomal protein S18 acetylase RimI-like enzyme